MIATTALRALLDDHEERYGCGDLWRAANEEIEKVGADTVRIDKLERILADEIYYNDVLLQSDSEDGVWVSLRDKGLHGTIVEDGQESKADTLRAALDAVPDRIKEKS